MFYFHRWVFIEVSLRRSPPDPIADRSARWGPPARPATYVITRVRQATMPVRGSRRVGGARDPGHSASAPDPSRDARRRTTPITTATTRPAGPARRSAAPKPLGLMTRRRMEIESRQPVQHAHQGRWRQQRRRPSSPRRRPLRQAPPMQSTPGPNCPCRAQHLNACRACFAPCRLRRQTPTLNPSPRAHPAAAPPKHAGGASAAAGTMPAAW